MAKCFDCRIKYDDSQNFCHQCGAALAKTGSLKFSSDEKNGFYERGIIHSLRGTSHSAQKEFENLLKINRRDADAYYQLAKIYEEKKLFRKALKVYRRCMKYDHEKKWEIDALERIKKLENKSKNTEK